MTRPRSKEALFSRALAYAEPRAYAASSALGFYYTRRELAANGFEDGYRAAMRDARVAYSAGTMSHFLRSLR